MARLQRLRWVPMLIKAYYDAQNQVGSPNVPKKAQDNRTEGTTAELTDAPVNTPEAPMRERSRRAKPQSHAKRLPKRSPSREQARHLDKNTRLLRELRVTNQKLGRLDSIQQQLQQMEEVLEGFNQQIGQLKTDKERLERETQASSPRKSAETTSDSDPGAQVPLYPF